MSFPLVTHTNYIIRSTHMTIYDSYVLWLCCKSIAWCKLHHRCFPRQSRVNMRCSTFMSLLWHHEVALVAVASYLLRVNCSDSRGEIRRQLRVGRFSHYFYHKWYLCILSVERNADLACAYFFYSTWVNKKHHHLQNDHPKNRTNINGPMNYGLP